jgi:thymidylate synthase
LRIEGASVAEVWFKLLRELHDNGVAVSPRQIGCHELLGVTLHTPNAGNNILVHPARNLNYRFMVAEWLWIWFGHEDVKTIAQYNANIAQFSDDGTKFAGAYGPPVRSHWPDVVDLFRRDPDTRQAVVAIYRRPVAPTRDVPCTLTLQFFCRRGQLHTIASMRSSDIWLGLPYDCFNFTMLSNVLASQLHLLLGSFTIHLGSSHLYDINREDARRVLDAPEQLSGVQSPQLTGPPPQWMDRVLADRVLHDPCINLVGEGLKRCGGAVKCVDDGSHMISCIQCGARYALNDGVSELWLAYAQALTSDTRRDALMALERMSQ